MKQKNWITGIFALVAVAILITTPLCAASYVEVDPSYSDTVTLSYLGDFYHLNVSKNTIVSYSIHVRNGSGVEVYLLKGEYDNLISAMSATYYVLYSAEEPTMDFSKSYTVTDNDVNDLTVLVFSEKDENVTYDITISHREKSTVEKIGDYVFGAIILLGLFIGLPLVRHYVRKSKREKMQAQQQVIMPQEQGPQQPYAPQEPSPPQEQNNQGPPEA